MALPLALQLYSLREAAAKDFPKVLAKVADMGYAGVEFAGLQGLDPGELAEMVEDLGMMCASAHMGVPTKETASKIVDEAMALGVGYIVSGGGPDDYKDMDSIKAIAGKFAAAAELLAPHGLQFGIHNHWWEFDHKVDGKCPHDLMMKLCGDAFAQVDVYWARFGGDDPAKVVKRNAGRVQLLHIKDGTLEKSADGRPTTPHTAVGAGKIDVPAVVAAGDKAGTQWLIVELDSCATDMEEACRQSAMYMIQNGLAEGSEPGDCCCCDDCEQ